MTLQNLRTQVEPGEEEGAQVGRKLVLGAGQVEESFRQAVAFQASFGELPVQGGVLANEGIHEGSVGLEPLGKGLSLFHLLLLLRSFPFHHALGQFLQPGLHVQGHLLVVSASFAKETGYSGGELLQGQGVPLACPVELTGSLYRVTHH